MTPRSLIAVLVGAGVGVLAAFGWRSAPRDTPPPLAPAAARALDVPSDPQPVVIARTAPTSTERTSAGEKPRAAPSVAPAMPVEDDTAIASKEEFEAAAIACDAKDAGACRRAAAAAELGAVVRKDPERARTFRRIELTTLVRACEKSSVVACLTLADRYLRGDFVAQNERTATALVEHAKKSARGVPKPPAAAFPKTSSHAS